FQLANCSWISVYVPKLDATCVLLAKKINNFEAYYIEQLFCSFESCVAICFQHQYPCNSIKYTRFAKQCELYIRNATYHSLPEDDETGQSRHFLLHSCHKAVPVGKLIHTPSMDADTTTANIHLPSIHRMCVVQKRPFVESYGIQRLQQITTSSLRLCLAACEAPTYSSCNSVLFSAQEETCILLARPQAFRFLGGTSATVETAAQYFINLFCRNDYKVGAFHTMQSFGRQPVIAYADSNSHMQILINHELFYGTKAAIRLQLWGSADEKECLKICIASIATDYCDAYYFSSRENTCLTMRMRKPYTFPVRHGQLIITKFYDDETLDVTLRDESEEYITYPDHFTELEVSLHEFKEICVTQHWISTLIPNVAFSKQYGNIVFFHECIHICRHLKNSGECKGIAYSKKMKTCMIAVDGNKNGEILLSNDQQYVTLSSCKKAVPVGKIIHTPSMNTDAITANMHLPSIHRVCVVQKRQFAESYGIERLEKITTSSLRRCLAACEAPTYSSCNSVLFSVQEETCILLARPQEFRFLGGTTPTVDSAAQFFIMVYCRNDFTIGASYTMQGFGRQPVIAYASSNSHMQIHIHHEHFYGTKAAIRLQLWDSADEKECLKICTASISADYCDAYYFSSRENTCLTMRMRKQYTLPIRHGQLIITKFYDDETLDVTLRDESEEYITYPDHFTELEVSLHEFKEICVTQHWISTLIPNVAFSKQYGNIVFFHECIHICRHLKNSGECKGIAYSKKMKTCMIAVDGNKNGEILLMDCVIIHAGSQPYLIDQPLINPVRF
ncbi:hypothetical protein T01_7987, partial [Trichinella spiralis]